MPVPPLSELKLMTRYRLLYPLLARFPRHLSYKLATLKGYLDEGLDRTAVQAARAGIQRVFPEASPAQTQALASAQQRMFRREILDVFWLPRLSPHNIDQFITLQGRENLEQAVASGRPVILYSSHFGRLIMPSMALGVKGIPTSCLTADISNPSIPPGERRYLAFKLANMLQVMGGEWVQKCDPLVRLYRILKARKILIVIVDPTPGPEDASVEIPFLGGQARLATGVVRLARKTGALLVPYFTVEGEQGLQGHFLPSIDLQGLAEQEAIGRIFQPVERYIRRYPDHWWLWQNLDEIWTER